MVNNYFSDFRSAYEYTQEQLADRDAKPARVQGGWVIALLDSPTPSLGKYACVCMFADGTAMVAEPWTVVHDYRVGLHLGKWGGYAKHVVTKYYLVGTHQKASSIPYNSPRLIYRDESEKLYNGDTERCAFCRWDEIYARDAIDLLNEGIRTPSA